jgi:hypothetical protein
MNDEIDVVTGQPVTITLGGKNYTAHRATLYDLGLLNRFKAQKEKDGDIGNLDIDMALFLLGTVIEPSITPDELSKLIPVSAVDEIKEAFAVVGFKMPQTKIQTKEVIGA